jgi:hypothetical protein
MRDYGEIRALGGGTHPPATFSSLEEVKDGEDQADRHGLGSHLRTLARQASSASEPCRLCRTFSSCRGGDTIEVMAMLG